MNIILNFKDLKKLNFSKDLENRKCRGLVEILRILWFFLENNILSFNNIKENIFDVLGYFY